MKKYLLDTNTCIYALKNTFANIRKNFDLHEDDEIYISTFSIAELLASIEKEKLGKAHTKIIKEFISKFEVIDFDIDTTMIYSKIRADLEKNGCKIDNMDILIASCAVKNKLILITNNEKEFKQVPNLKIENWTK